MKKVMDIRTRERFESPTSAAVINPHGIDTPSCLLCNVKSRSLLDWNASSLVVYDTASGRGCTITHLNKFSMTYFSRLLLRKNQRMLTRHYN